MGCRLGSGVDERRGRGFARFPWCKVLLKSAESWSAGLFGFLYSRLFPLWRSRNLLFCLGHRSTARGAS